MTVITRKIFPALYLTLPVGDGLGGLLAADVAAPVLGDERPVLLAHHQRRNTGDT
jgi:hypothetical protein